MVALVLMLGVLWPQTPINQLQDQNLGFWVRLLESPQIEVRLNALKTLSDIKHPESIPAIARQLSHEQPRVRYQAAWTLGRIPEEKSQEFLSQRLPDEDDVYVRGEINRSIRLLREVFERQLDEMPSEQEIEELLEE